MSRSLGNIQKGMLIVIMVIILICLSGCMPSWTVVRVYDGPKKPVEETAIVFAISPSVIVTAIDNKPKRTYNAYLCELHLLPGKHSITAQTAFITAHSLEHNIRYVGRSLTVSANFQKGFVYELKSNIFYQDEHPDRWQLFLEKKGTIEEIANSPAPVYCDDGKLYPYPYTLWKDAPRHWRDFRAPQHQKRN